ncbi:MAG: NUDIX domain-containing protein [Candidatus Liptonbacteria bacterium]|nr:NUDIX domain-containing protein [Candidatus Liptonbacteria bacterium]
MMTKKEAQTLARLLKKIPEQNFFIPDEAFEPLHGAVSMWAPELVILRKRTHGAEILLTPYQGKFARGYWHIPGGYNIWNETIQETCSRVAKRELDFDVKYLEVLDADKWREGEHPYGRPLSVYVLCEPRKTVRETADMKFWDASRLPRKMITIHRRFIARHFHNRRRRK